MDETSAPSLPTPDQLYRAASAFEERRSFFAPNLTTGEQLILEAQELLLQSILALPKAMADALQGQLAQVTTQQAPQQTTQSRSLLSLNFVLSQMTQTLVAIPQARTYLAGSANQIGVLVTAGGSTTVVIPVTPGYVLGFLGDIQTTPSSVSAGVTLKVLVDGYSVIGPDGFVLGPGASVPVSQFNYFASRTGVEAVVENPSSQDVTVYFAFEMVNVAAVFYEQFILQVFNGAYDQIKLAYGITGV